MTPSADAAAYFRARPFDRLMCECRRTLQRLSRLGGHAYLDAPTPGELDALQGFFGRPLYPAADGRLPVSLVELDRHLRESTRFQCGLVEALEAYFGEPLLTRADVEARRRQAWRALVDRLADVLAAPEAARWWSAPGGGKDQARRLFRAALPPADAEATLEAALAHPAVRELERSLRQCALALAELPEPSARRLPLPVFAHRITGNPHAFDAGTLAGRLLEAALQRDPALARAAMGLHRDEVSSTVLCYGLAGAAGPDGRQLAAVQAARRDGQVVAWPLREVRHWRTAWAAHGRVFVVENPSVLSVLVDLAAPTGREVPTIVCPSGQPSAAALHLLDLLAAAGCRLHYSGDFDPAGLAIAAGLKARYGDRLVPWRMDANSYRLSLARSGATGQDADPAIQLTDADEGQLARLAATFPELVDAMRQERRKAYQEGLVDELQADVTAAPP